MNYRYEGGPADLLTSPWGATGSIKKENKKSFIFLALQPRLQNIELARSIALDKCISVCYIAEYSPPGTLRGSFHSPARTR